MKTLRYEALDGWEGIVMVDKIVRMDKDISYPGRALTRIHLTNGEVIPTMDSINTLEARLNSKED